MLPGGFLGTRADLLMDIILVAVVSVPFILVYSFKLARQMKTQAHKTIQVLIFTVVFLAVIAFEINIYLSGGTVLSGEGYSTTTSFKVFLAIHIVVAVITYASWGWLLVSSRKSQNEKNLPGSYSKNHKKIGMRIFWGSCFTSVSGFAIYIMGFVL